MVNRNDIYELRGPLGLSHLMHLYDVDRYDLKEKVFKQAATSFQPAGGPAMRTCFQRHPLRRHPGAPPVSVLRSGHRVPQNRRPRSPGAGHQADPLSRGARVAGGQVPARGPAEFTASRSRCWWNSKRASTRPAISAGRVCWRGRGSTSSTAWWGSRLTPRHS
jgi:hypothetical protein